MDGSQTARIGKTDFHAVNVSEKLEFTQNAAKRALYQQSKDR